MSSDALNTKENNGERNDDTGREPEEGESQEGSNGDEGTESEEGREDTKAKGNRSGSKAEKVLELMKRKEGATLAEIPKATDWQNHSIRGFVSGHVTTELGLKVESTKSEAGNARTGS